MQCAELALVELDGRQVVVLGWHRIEIALKRIVAGALNGKAQAHALKFGSVGVEAAKKCLLAHTAVALNRLVDLLGGDRARLRHQECDQRKLPHKFVVIPLGQSPVPSIAALAGC